jgi:hypothetical protein
MSVTPIGGVIGGVIATALSPTWALLVAGIVGVSSAVPLVSRRVLAIRV